MGKSIQKSQLLILDFKNLKNSKIISEKQFLDKVKRYQMPVLKHDAVSHKTDKQCFRAVFINDVPIDDERVTGIMQKALITIFPEADIFSKNSENIEDTIYLSMTIESLFRNMTIYFQNEYGYKHYKRKIADFARINGIALNKNKLLNITTADYEPFAHSDSVEEQFGAKSPNTIVYIKASGENYPKRYHRIKLEDGSNNDSDDDTKTYKNHKTYRSNDIKSIRPKCELFRDFEDGTRKLNDDELLAIASSLVNVESGRTLFLDILRDNVYHKSNFDYWEKTLKYLNESGDQPMNCDSFCRYKSICSHGDDILTTAILNGIEKILSRQDRLYSVDEALDDFQRKFNEIADAECTGFFEPKVYVLNSPSGLGKTEIYLDYMKYFKGKILIVVSTNKLKDEAYQRALQKDIDNIKKAPSLYQLKKHIPKDVWKQIDLFYNSGRHDSVVPYIREVLKLKNIPRLTSYLKDLEEFQIHDGHAIITHKRFTYLRKAALRKYDVVIIDEDLILNSFISDQVNIKISDIKKLLKSITPAKENEKLIRKLKMVLTQTKNITLPEIFLSLPTENDSYLLEEYVYDCTSTPIDIQSFCKTTHFCYRKSSKDSKLEEDCISFFKPLRLPRDIKYIMLSATADKYICRYFFECYQGLKMIYYYCKRAYYTGKVYQYSDKSFSRTSIEYYPDIINKITSMSTFEAIISFKELKLGDVYFGKTTGVDYLKGKNLIVFGTPHQPEFIYKLFAFTLGLGCDLYAKLKHKSKDNIVDYKEYRFSFTTYDDEILRTIQFWMISSELEQAVGRARLLRFNCDVVVYSNFPVFQAKIIQKSKHE